MSSKLTRRFVAGTSAVAMAVGMAVTMGVGAAGAVPGSVTWSDGATKFTQTVSNTTPIQGEVITTAYKFERTNIIDEYLYQIRDNHSPCLKYVEGSAKVDGSPRGIDALGVDFARVAGNWIVNSVAGPKSRTVEFSYTVGANCARDTALSNHLSYTSSLSNGKTYTYAGKGPTFTIAKNVSTMTINQIDAAAVGKPVTVKARVQGSQAGDKVQFSEGATQLGSGTTDSEGWAEYVWTPAAAGAKTIRAAYAATPFATASDASRDTDVAQANVVSNTSITAAPAQVGRASSLTATISPAGAGGEVDFYENGVSAGTATVGADSKAVVSWLPTTAGNVQVTAFFRGRNGVAPSDTAISATVAAKPPNSVVSETTLRVEGSPQVGVASSLIANVDPKDAGGSVTFSVNGVQIGEAPVNSGGVAVFAWTPAEAGFHDLAAVYSGAGLVDGSAATAATTVAPANENPDGGDGGAGSLGSLGGLFGSLGG